MGRTLLFPLLVGAALLVFPGCGGSGNPPAAPAAPTAALKLDLVWPERSRGVAAPGSALSAVLSLQKGDPRTGGAVTFPALDRGEGTAGYTQNYVSPTVVRTGPNFATLTFYAEKGGKGAVVAAATRAFTLGADGAGLGDLLLVGKVETVTVSGSASLAVGGGVALSFTAKDGAGRTVAVSPGSASFAVASGDGSLAISPDGQATGLAVGEATVTATVDGKASAPFSLKVTAPAGAQAVIAAGQSVAVGARKKLVFSVTDAEGKAVSVDPAQISFSLVAGDDVADVAADGTVTGKKVGTASIRLKAGDLVGTPTPVAVVASGPSNTIEIPALQSVKVQETKTLAFTAKDANGAPLPVGSGGAKFALTGGGDFLTLTETGEATGKAPGFAVVTVTVSGITSAPQTVFIGDVVTNASGLKFIEKAVGAGAQPANGQKVTLNYTGTLLSGVKFDSSLDPGRQPFSFKLNSGQVIKGFDEGVASMKVGGKRLLILPPDLAYGASGTGSIPPHSTLVFDLELLKVEP